MIYSRTENPCVGSSILPLATTLQSIIGSIFETCKQSNNLGLITIIIDYFTVDRGGIEPPTHGFSVREYIIT